MAWVSEHKLVAAVANAGATGVIALGGPRCRVDSQ